MGPLAVALLGGPCALCAEEDASAAPPGLRLLDATARSGITFRHVSGSAEKDWITEVNGGGVVIFDADGDGDQDLYLINGVALDGRVPAPRNELWRNEGGWRFVNATAESGVGDTGWGSGAVAGDLDGDGRIDLYVTNNGPNVLYWGRGDGTFERGLETGAEDPSMSVAAALADFNRDGLLDLYVSNYLRFDRATARRRGDPGCEYKGVPIFCGPGGLTPARDTLYLQGPPRSFHDASAAWGLERVPPAYGMGVLVLDLQGDLWPDVLVANDTMPNYLLLNDKGVGFQEAALFVGLAYNDLGVAQGSMGLACADTRGLGRRDIFVTNFEDDSSTLYREEPGGMYLDETFPAGLGTPSYLPLSWGAVFLDIDLDGDEDLFVANGHVAPQADSIRGSPGYAQRNQLFLNDGRGRFTEVPPGGSSGLEVLRSSRGAACGDLDGDGDLDIVVSNMDAPTTIIENAGAPAHAWAAFRLRGLHCPIDALGARIELTCGGRTQVRWVRAGESYASQCERIARFGLGAAEAVEGVTVTWPCGRREPFAPPKARVVVELVEGEGLR